MPTIIKPNGQELEVNENTIRAMRDHGALPNYKIKVKSVEPKKDKAK